MTKLKKLIIDIDGKEVEFTEKQAKSLYDELERLFGRKVDTIPMPYPVYPRPWVEPYYLRWSDGAEEWKVDLNKIYCTTTIVDSGSDPEVGLLSSG